MKHDHLTDDQLRALEREHQRDADDLQRQAAAAQRRADACRKELRRRKRDRALDEPGRGRA